MLQTVFAFVEADSSSDARGGRINLDSAAKTFKLGGKPTTACEPATTPLN
jgi:hypothetical protein